MRTLFHIVSALCLLMCVALALLWIRSHHTADYLAYCAEKKELGMISTVGKVLFYHESAIEPFRWKSFEIAHVARPAPPSINDYALPRAASRASWIGFGTIRGENSEYRASAVYVPYWSLILLTMISPLLWARRQFQKRSYRGFALGGEPRVSGENKQ